jgi:hypothetical protein
MNLTAWQFCEHHSTLARIDTIMKSFSIGLVVLGVYLILVSVFLSEDVLGGVRGGSPVGTGREGNTVVTYFVGGEQIVYRANMSAGQQVRMLAIGSLALSLVVGVIHSLRNKTRFSEYFETAMPAGIRGLFAGFITGMPVALLMKNMSGSMLIYCAPLYVVAILILLFVCIYAEKAKKSTLS